MTGRLDQELVRRGMFDSRAQAQAAIAAGLVRVNGSVVRKASLATSAAAMLEAEAAHRWVGRGALKLEHALELWPISVVGKVVLDVGASTGGFTEVCLDRGARRVFAVDVGRDQLHARLRTDERVVCLEGVDARKLDRALLPEAPELVVSDVSFIGLAKALPVALGLAAAEADLIALVKPQFEVGPENVGKGGLVRDPELRAQAEDSVRAFLDGSGWNVRAAADSPIEGGDGNLERLLWAQKRQ